MLKILVPVDGSPNAERALSYAIQYAGNSKQPVELHLLNVQLPIVSGDVKMFISQQDINDYYRDKAEEVLAPARRALEAAGVKYVTHIGVGQPAETIVAHQVDKQCEQIIMGSRGLGAVSGLVMGSVARKVVHLANVPVTLVK